MDFFSVLSLVGGLALFLYGMSVMGGGLEKVAGSKMEKTLEKLTNNVFKSVLLGALVTAIIQSSSATTVIVVGFVNAGILKLRQAIGVIMGANIGTTVTAQIIALGDISSDNFFLKMLKPSSLSPLIAAIGILLYLFSKRTKRKELGEIFLGFSVLFTGLFAMESAVSPLKDSPVFADIMVAMTNPILGVLTGALVTAIIQSSSASVGILQALSSTGQLTYASAFPIIMGQNIGTCVTPLLSSIGANKNAKRAAMVHLYFNIIGTIVFLTLIYLFQYFIGFPFWQDAITKSGIANFHIIFNVFTTLLFLPFTKLLACLAEWTIRDDEDGQKEVQADLLDERFLQSPAIALQQCKHSVVKMAQYARANFNEASSILQKYDSKAAGRINEYEDAIDKMEDRLGNYLLRLNDGKLSENESRDITELLHIISEYERIGDYSVNLMESAQQLVENGLSFSETAKEELAVSVQAIDEIIGLATDAYMHSDVRRATLVEPLEETVDDIVALLKDRHIKRLRDGSCQIYAGITFLEVLTNLERIADHCANIAVYVISRETKSSEEFDRHVYQRKIHDGSVAAFNQMFQDYEKKYLETIRSIPMN